MKTHKKLKLCLAILLVISVITSSTVFAANIQIFKSYDVKSTTIHSSEVRDTIINSIEGSQKKIFYDKTRVNELTGAKDNVYHDDIGNQYILNNNGNVTGFLKSEKVNTNIGYSAKQSVSAPSIRKQLCDNYISKYFNLASYK